MKKNLTQLINNQINKLEADDFDLEAWKASTITLLKKVPGNKNPGIEQIEKLKIDYSSWTLRDSNASYKPIESCKRIGREVLESVLDDLSPNEEYEIPIQSFFSKKDIKILLGSNTNEEEKRAIVRKLKKTDLENLILSLFQTD